MTSLLVRHPLFHLQGLFVWSTVSKRFIMACDKHFKKCANPCPRFLTLDDTHDLCIICLSEEHALSVLEGVVCVHCERFLMKKLPDICAPWLGSCSRWGKKETEIVGISDGALLQVVLSLTSSGPAVSTLLSSSQDNQEVADEGEEVETTKSSQPLWGPKTGPEGKEARSEGSDLV